MSRTLVLVQSENFDTGALTEQLRCDDARSGAVVTFTGIVRELVSDHSLKGLYLEHYPGMTEKALEKIVAQARERWELGNVIVLHRVGRMALNENIVFVGVASAHRKNAFEASQFIMDYLKRDAPFWKKEITAQGESWVDQKATDLSAAESWKSR
ncbi:molybdopterin synthase catalytic subunit MoaE [Marinobacterium jannaschii]|uniref:molybdopterin synthase catalytic subunit MoaE n=1 Tax=Marinobacterium jannaschii TaxID=64970 RepID=UPI000482A240|nr:molybdopterin synthase catalytic subunit MoaE [Marinobacterium jannaschii]